MSFPTYVPTFAFGAEEARRAPVVAWVTADQQISDTFTARSITRQLGLARRIASSDPAAPSQLLFGWMSHMAEQALPPNGVRDAAVFLLSLGEESAARKLAEAGTISVGTQSDSHS
jgi:hypothetical protein